MSLIQKLIEELKFSDLRVRYGTGRSIFVSGSGRDKKYRYRYGAMTDLGDLEISEWKSLMNALIDYHGERELQEQLRQWSKTECLFLHSKDEVEEYALELHASRIFDNPAWVDYIPFNRKYRPEVLETADLVWIQNICCKSIRQVTRTQYENMARQGGNAAYCYVCGDWTAVTLAEPPMEGESERA